MSARCPAAVSLLVAASAVGCFDFEAAGRCYGQPEGCERDAAAGAPDGAGGDAPDDAGGEPGGPSLCSGLAVALCDGFEGPSLNPLWSPDESPPQAAIALDATRAFRGAQSLHVHFEPMVAGESRAAEISEHQTETPTPLPEHWVRAYYYFPSTSVWRASSRIMTLTGSGTPYETLELKLTAGFLEINNDRVGANVISGTWLPTDRWVCVEMEVTATRIRVWLDGGLVPDLDLLQDTPVAGGVRLGASPYNVPAAEDAVDFWLDEVIIDGVRGSCAL